MAEEVLGLEDVARLCRVSRDTVDRWIGRQGLPAVAGPEGVPRVDRAALDVFLKSHGIWSPAALSGGGSPRVLIVDDEPDVRALALRVIRRLFPAAWVEEAADGFEAGSRVMSLEPHLLILDVHLPGLEGVAVCRRVRSFKGFKEMRIVAISGDKNPTLRETLLKEGVDAFLPKPFYPRDLEAAVGPLLAPR